MPYKSETTSEAAKQRDIQRGVDAKDKSKPSKEKQGAMQAGARKYPEPPFPKQHQAKPGDERKVTPAPLYDAPYYIGSKKLEGKVALITGADSGIGRAVAVLFAREGADVAIVYLAEDRDAETTKAAVEAEGKRAILIKADVSEREHCRKAVEKTVREFGGLDVLVNNAAFQYHAEDFGDITEKHFDTTLKTNLYGYFHMAQEAVPHMKPGSAIVNTGSITGIDGSKALVDYSMTKGGIHAFTRALAGNLVPKGIRVNAVAPGPVWTPLNPADKPAEKVKDFGKHNPMGRPAQPEELAPAYVFLAAPSCASYISGAVIPVMGGPTG